MHIISPDHDALATDRRCQVDGQFRALHIRLGAFCAGTRQVGVFRAFGNGIFNGQRVQAYEFISRLNNGSTLNHPDDGVLAAHPTFDLSVFSAFQGALLCNRKGQVAPCDCMG